MANQVSKRFTLVEWCLSAAALTLLVGVMVAMDTPVRHMAESAALDAGKGSLELRVPRPIMDAGRTAWRICLDHRPLAGFAGVACVLVLFMRRMR
jgi:hypothetical protein